MNSSFYFLYHFKCFTCILLLFITLNATKAYCQKKISSKQFSKTITGKYTSPRQDFNKFTSELIILNNDSTFEYTLKDEFIKINSRGYWHVSKNNLILNSKEKKSKIIVVEKANKSLQQQIKFEVSYKDGSPMNYQLYLISNKDTFVYKDSFSDTVIDHHISFNEFYIIDSRGLKYPTYFVKNKKSNHYIIKLEVDRIFDNEKWKITDGGLQPVELNGMYARYYLSKKVD